MVNTAEVEDWTFDLCAGQLALDFANTVGDRHTSRPFERLTSFERLIAFAVQTSSCSPGIAKRLRLQSRRHPRDAAEVLADAIVLRDAIYGITSRYALGLPLRASDTVVLTEHVRRFELDSRLDWRWEARHHGLDVVLGPIVRAAVDVLRVDRRDHLRICEADDCAWVFFDASKNHSRRWCDMKQCGNRAKARRFARHRTDRQRGRA